MTCKQPTSRQNVYHNIQNEYLFEKNCIGEIKTMMSSSWSNAPMTNNLVYVNPIVVLTLQSTCTCHIECGTHITKNHNHDQ
jgi:hypothetical protein